MSRVHDALRRAEQAATVAPVAPPSKLPVSSLVSAAVAGVEVEEAPDQPGVLSPPAGLTPPVLPVRRMEGFLGQVRSIPFQPLPEALLIDPAHNRDAPAEEFRTLRTRLNHMQSLQPIHTVVITSPSPTEGKSFAAANLALAEAQLSGNMVLLADFDFRRPIVHSLFQTDRGPGITDYLQGKIQLQDAMRRVGDTNLFIMPAGEAVINPLELLNLKEVKQLLDFLPTLFNWAILDSPPLLFAADANLLSTLSHGTILVVRIGSTTIDSVSRAMQSLCQNNVLGIIVNGARRGELYSKYAYYHSYYSATDDEKDAETAATAEAAS